MNALQKIDAWGQTHHPVWADFLRIPFGVALIVKGIFFIHNTSDLVQLMEANSLGHSHWIAYLIAWVHIVGGLFIAVGLITRIAIVAQLPILIGAVFFVNTHRDMATGNGEFLLSIIMLLLLVFYLIEGPGKFSLDALVKGLYDREEKPGTIENKEVRTGTTSNVRPPGIG